MRAEAEATAEKLRELKLEIPVKAGEKGRLFGAVTAHQIARPHQRGGDRARSPCAPSARADQGARRLQDRRPAHAGRRDRPSPSASSPSPDGSDPADGPIDATAAAAAGPSTWKERLGVARPRADRCALRDGCAALDASRFASRTAGRDGVRGYVTQRVSARSEDPRVWIGEPIVDGDRAVDLMVGLPASRTAPMRRWPGPRSCASTPTAWWSSSGMPGTSWPCAATRRAGARSPPHDT